MDLLHNILRQYGHGAAVRLPMVYCRRTERRHRPMACDDDNIPGGRRERQNDDIRYLNSVY